jgi:predicted DNA-binding transcriptional regulator AlpA
MGLFLSEVGDAASGFWVGVQRQAARYAVDQGGNLFLDDVWSKAMNDQRIHFEVDVAIAERSVTILAEIIEQSIRRALEQRASPRSVQAVSQTKPTREISRPPQIAPAPPPSTGRYLPHQSPLDAQLDKDAHLLIDTRQAARLLKVSSRTLFNMYTNKLMPEPLRLNGHSIRWGLAELTDWVKHGCPPQSEWTYPPKP